jgi:hypothetical protein
MIKLGKFPLVGKMYTSMQEQDGKVALGMQQIKKKDMITAIIFGTHPKHCYLC